MALSAAAGCIARLIPRRAWPSSSNRFASEFVTEERILKVDRAAGMVSATAILSWHEAAFVAAYASKAGEKFASRSPIERALIAFVMPQLLPLEREFIDENRFKVTFQDFDWRLNDLTGGRIE